MHKDELGFENDPTAQTSHDAWSGGIVAVPLNLPALHWLHKEEPAIADHPAKHCKGGGAKEEQRGGERGEAKGSCSTPTGVQHPPLHKHTHAQENTMPARCYKPR